MSWNYRVLKHQEGEESWHSIHEVYYNDDGSLSGYIDATDFIASDNDELKMKLEQMLDCLAKPVLTLSDFEPGQ